MNPVEMGTLTGTCEIVESIEESDSESKLGEQAGRSRILRQGQKYSIEDDINQLFEAIDLSSSVRGLGLSPQVSRDALRKSAMKKPIRVSSSQASGIGISESVSLKQALRGLCISQASEMAAMKRLSKPAGSSGASEAGTIKRLYRAVVVEASESGLPHSEGKGNLVEISLVPESNTSNSSEKAPESLKIPKAEVFKPTASSSCPADATSKARLTKRLPQIEVVPLPIEVATKKSKTQLGQNGEPKATESSSSTHTCQKVPELDEIVPSSVELPTKTSVPDKGQNSVPKNDKEQRGKLHSSCSLSSSSAGSKGSKSASNSPCLVNPLFRSKSFVKKKVKQDSSSASSSSNPCNGEVCNDLDPCRGKLVCQTQNYCSKNGREENDKASPASSSSYLSIEVSSSVVDTGASKAGNSSSCSNRIKTVVTKADERSRSREKGEFSQSSKSSIGEYSSSTSISEESSLSGSNRSGNRPHMSKDLRWEAIRHVQKQHENLSLRHFKLLKRLGCGDIGTVYLAELTGTNCLFALKVMDNEFLSSRKKMSRAQTEREILQMLDHPFLPTLYAHFTTDKLSCLVMEYCPGGDLHVLRQKQPSRSFSEQAARYSLCILFLFSK